MGKNPDLPTKNAKIFRILLSKKCPLSGSQFSPFSTATSDTVISDQIVDQKKLVICNPD